jgi:phosphoribosylformimino-5-aminoimidazole carboxamide ribotide isomerase
MQIIPSIDLWEGKVVRLRQGRYEDLTVYADDAVELAGSWRGVAERLHIVDLAGAKYGHRLQADVVRDVAAAFGPGVQIGGGVRSLEALEGYLELGVERVVLGTAAVSDPEFVRDAARRHPGRLILAVDAKSGFVATQGWQDVTEIRATELAARFASEPIAALLYTDIERDGTEVGPNVKATADLARAGSVPVLASGGVGTLEHLRQLAAASRECDGRIAGVVIGRALHERRFSLHEALQSVLEGTSKSPRA